MDDLLQPFVGKARLVVYNCGEDWISATVTSLATYLAKDLFPIYVGKLEEAKGVFPIYVGKLEEDSDSSNPVQRVDDFRAHVKNGSVGNFPGIVISFPVENEQPNTYGKSWHYPTTYPLSLTSQTYHIT